MEQARHPDGTPKWIHHCLWCGKDFTGIFSKIFCSEACRLNHWRNEKKVEKSTTQHEPLSWGKKRFKVFERDHFRCRYCGRGPMDNAILHADHIFPKSKGGSDKMDNLITSCQDCNFGKNADILSFNPFIEFTTA
jgi:hypothetical protein